MSSFSGPTLRAFRKFQRLTAAELGQRVDRTEWTVWSYESGRATPPLDVALELADVLGVSLDELLTGDRGAAA